MQAGKLRQWKFCTTGGRSISTCFSRCPARCPKKSGHSSDLCFSRRILPGRLLSRLTPAAAMRPPAAPLSLSRPGELSTAATHRAARASARERSVFTAPALPAHHPDPDRSAPGILDKARPNPMLQPSQTLLLGGKQAERAGVRGADEQRRAERGAERGGWAARAPEGEPRADRW